MTFSSKAFPAFSLFRSTFRNPCSLLLITCPDNRLTISPVSKARIVLSRFIIEIAARGERCCPALHPIKITYTFHDVGSTRKSPSVENCRRKRTDRSSSDRVSIPLLLLLLLLLESEDDSRQSSTIIAAIHVRACFVQAKRIERAKHRFTTSAIVN